MSKSKSGIKYEMSSGNIFADMGLPDPEEHLVKARLARLINKAVAESGRTQKETAKVLGITQPKVSDISRGRLKNFSVEQLMKFLPQLDHRVTITVSHGDEPPEEIVITPRPRRRTTSVRAPAQPG